MKPTTMDKTKQRRDRHIDTPPTSYHPKYSYRPIRRAGAAAAPAPCRRANPPIPKARRLRVTDITERYKALGYDASIHAGPKEFNLGFLPRLDAWATGVAPQRPKMISAPQ